MPKYNNPRKAWQYADEFKIRAVKMCYQEGIQIRQIAEGRRIHTFMLSRWRKEYREGKIRPDLIIHENHRSQANYRITG